LNNINNGSSFLGRNNTAIGSQALVNNTTGNDNIAIGFSAGGNLTTGNDNIDIGCSGVAGESGTTHIGTPGKQNATFIAGIFGATVSGAAVIVDSAGHLGTITSSARFKEAIKPMDKASEAILALNPVTFRYKEDADPNKTTQFGLVAEEVDKISPDLVIHDEEGKPFTVRYEAVNAMLLNEFLKEHRKVAQHQNTIAELKSAIANQQAANAKQQQEIETLTLELQKVTARLELSASAPRVGSGN
jgi:uncharacterized coiled-coil protein SlyX